MSPSPTARSPTPSATTGRGRPRPRRATSPTAAPTRPSSAAGRGPAPRSRPTRSAGSAQRCAATPPRPRARGSGTTPTSSRSPCGPPRRRCSRRSSTHGSPPSRRSTATTAPTSSTWPRSNRPKPLASGFEAHDAARLALRHAALLDEQVDVAEHLAEREVGLRDRDVAPQRLGDLVGRAGALLDQPADLARAPVVEREALVDQLHVVGDGVAVPGEDDLDVHVARLAQRAHVGQQRPRAPAPRLARPPAERARGSRGRREWGGPGGGPPGRAPR